MTDCCRFAPAQSAPPAASPDPHLLLPSCSGGPPTNLFAPSPFPPTGHRVPLPPAARAVVDAFVVQHGLAPPAALRKTLAAYLNVSVEKLKNHLTGRRRKEKDQRERQSAQARADERAKEEREREERRAREEVAREERRATEAEERETSHAWAQVFAEWDQLEQSRRRQAGLEYYWASGDVWVDGNDIRDVPPPGASVPSDDDDSADDARDGGPGRDLVDALLRDMFGPTPKDDRPRAHKAIAGTGGRGAYTAPSSATAAGACTPSPPLPGTVPINPPTPTSAHAFTSSRTPTQTRSSLVFRRAATVAATHAALGRPHPYVRRARTSSSSSSAVAPAGRRRSLVGRR